MIIDVLCIAALYFWVCWCDFVLVTCDCFAFMFLYIIAFRFFWMWFDWWRVDFWADRPCSGFLVRVWLLVLWCLMTVVFACFCLVSCWFWFGFSFLNEWLVCIGLNGFVYLYCLACFDVFCCWLYWIWCWLTNACLFVVYFVVCCFNGCFVLCVFVVLLVNVLVSAVFLLWVWVFACF